ncbi:MAG: hypothetical protein AB1473_18255 [Thermodesulfobacteriota bacterium]
MGFEPDEQIQQIATAYAEDAIELARDHFGLTLDWSDESVRHVETILAAFHSQILAANPSEDLVYGVAKALGSYVGEVFRKNHGAVWGNVTLGYGTFPGLRADRTGGEFWPWEKAYDRLRNGPEDNIWHYYCLIRAQDGNGPALEELDLSSSPPKKPWWRKIFGGG